MTGKTLKTLTLTILDQKYNRNDWSFDFEGVEFQRFIIEITREMNKFGFALTCVQNHDIAITINSYADLLNCVKVSSDNCQGTHCIGHIIGKSKHLNIVEDIDSGIRKIVFAPETVAPASEYRTVCHNCGCGC